MISKPFSVKFKLDAKLLALIYICYRYKFPASMMLSFYEMYGEQSLFILKAMSCAHKITLNDNTFIKIIEQSKLLHKQVITGVSTKMKIKQLETMVKRGRKIEEEIPEQPQLNMTEFSDDYAQFINTYLLKNVVDIYADKVELLLDTNDLYCELTK